MQVERVSKAATPYLSHPNVTSTTHHPVCPYVYVCVYYIYIPIAHVISHPITYLSYLFIYSHICHVMHIMPALAVPDDDVALFIVTLRLKNKIYSFIRIKNKFLFRLPWNMDGMFIFTIIFIIFLVSALKNESRETHAKTHHAVLCRAFMVGWLPTALFLVSFPSLPFPHFITLPFLFAPLSILNLLHCH